MINAELGIETLDQVGEFMHDIDAYLEALKVETGKDNPDIVINELFARTNPDLHEELRAAIWSKTEGNWMVKPMLTEAGDYQLVLSQEEKMFHYM